MAQAILASPESAVNASSPLPHVRKIRKAWRQKLSPIAWYILSALAEHADRADTCTLSIARMARENGLSQNTVRDAVRELIALGLVKHQPRRGRSYRWKLLLDVYDLTSHARLPEDCVPDSEEGATADARPPLSHGEGAPYPMVKGSPSPWDRRSDYKEATTESEEVSASRTAPSSSDNSERSIPAPQVVKEDAQKSTSPPAGVPARPPLRVVVDPQDAAIIEEFRTAYHKHVDSAYRFQTPYPASETRAVRQLRAIAQPEEISRVIDFVVYDQRPPLPGKTWTGWAAVIQSVAALTARFDKLDSAGRKAKAFKPQRTQEEQAAINREVLERQTQEMNRRIQEDEREHALALSNPDPEIARLRAETRRRLRIHSSGSERELL